MSELPLLFYLPGIDGTGLAASRQFPSLAREFDLRALSIPGHDRTPFRQLVELTMYDPPKSHSGTVCLILYLPIWHVCAYCPFITATHGEGTPLTDGPR